MNERAPLEEIDLERRVAPRQKRSQARIQNIVDATKSLLERGQLDITTSSVAQEADVPVSSVYRYFPNIYSIHRTILEEFQDDTDKIVEGILADPDYQDWRPSVSGMLRGLRQLIQDTPAYGAVLRLTMTTLELRAVKDDWNRKISEVFASRWRQGLDNFKDGDPDIVARMAVEIYTSAEVIAFEKRLSPEQADAYFDEAMTALERYLAPYLD
ncbi:MAG: TetR/AcrR family transcriptional regulator [Alphaproteobacteria bacterium]|nr:TetR/AcrR family transcriptional regulator [Alphaproteobacteria bacterium]